MAGDATVPVAVQVGWVRAILVPHVGFGVARAQGSRAGGETLKQEGLARMDKARPWLCPHRRRAVVLPSQPKGWEHREVLATAQKPGDGHPSRAQRGKQESVATPGCCPSISPAPRASEHHVQPLS